MSTKICSIIRYSKLRITSSKHFQIRFASSILEAIEKRNELFNLEKKRQKEVIGRIEKIEVKYCGQPEPISLVMNKSISTPYNCAQHLGKMHMDRSALALVNDKPWDMHRPLPDNCSLDFLHFTINDPYIVNKAYWRTCSFLLGATACIAFKDKIKVLLHSFPSPKVKSGSFIYDIDLSLEEWKPREDELRVLSTEMIKFCSQHLPIECLDVSCDLALVMFEENRFKSLQIPYIAEQNNGKVTLYRVGKHMDISRGPMIANTSFIGRCTVAAVHKTCANDCEHLYRFQGVSLPKTIILNHFAYRILEERAKKFNEIKLPNPLFQQMEENIMKKINQ